MSTKKITTCDICDKTIQHNHTHREYACKLLVRFLNTKKISSDPRFPQDLADICAECVTAVEEGLVEPIVLIFEQRHRNTLIVNAGRENNEGEITP